MSKFKVGDLVRATNIDGDTEHGMVGHEGKLQSARSGSTYDWRLDGVAVNESELELVVPEPKAGDVLDRTVTKVTKTVEVEEEFIEYPEFPDGTVIADGNDQVYKRFTADDYGNGVQVWYKADTTEYDYGPKDFVWPVTVLRYGKAA